ncbi:hypothetical protein Pint_11264 [Pistacia integerrima]|uniref:Uncharacterized protein n=2 Tax=Pistacia TaxID=55512 RepID=A0ACC1A405_9ROSI|nr:hypothetical protein Pint_11264 [Pistacia integerrima]KAJ0081993.1 hypothetical protein Patl1_11430 [Pistacia atlantica]
MASALPASPLLPGAISHHIILIRMVMKFEDLKELGSEAAVKAAGKYKQEGKTYVVQDGDIIFFKFNVSGGGKK